VGGRTRVVATGFVLRVWETFRESKVLAVCLVEALRVSAASDASLFSNHGIPVGARGGAYCLRWESRDRPRENTLVETGLQEADVDQSPDRANDRCGFQRDRRLRTGHVDWRESLLADVFQPARVMRLRLVANYSESTAVHMRSTFAAIG